MIVLRFPKRFMSARGDLREFQKNYNVSKDFKRIKKSSRGFQGVSRDLQRVSEAFQQISGFFIGFQRCYRGLQVSGVFEVIHGRERTFQ